MSFIHVIGTQGLGQLILFGLAGSLAACVTLNLNRQRMEQGHAIEIGIGGIAARVKLRLLRRHDRQNAAKLAKQVSNNCLPFKIPICAERGQIKKECLGII